MPVREVAGCRINYREAGQGPPVILLHCSSSHSGQWKPLMAALEDRFRLLAPDLHGYGRSDPLPDDDRTVLEHDGDILAAFLDAEGPAHVVGHSLGGAVSYAVARSRGDLKSLTMIEPVLFCLLAETGHPEAGDPDPVTRAASRAMRDGKPGDGARAFVDFWSGPGADDAMDDTTRDYVRSTMDRALRDLEGLSAGAPGAPTLADARGIACPVHLMRGGQSRASARAIVAALARALPGAALSEIPGAAHMAAATQPDLINPHIAAYLDARET